MTPEETQSLLTEIITGIETGVGFVGVIDPALIPAIVIGKAVGNLVPGIAASVQRWIEGNPPTDAEKAELAAKLETLGNPDLP